MLGPFFIIALTARYYFVEKKTNTHTCQDKYDSPLSEVELLESNLHYTFILHPDERQSNVSLRGLAST